MPKETAPPSLVEHFLQRLGWGEEETDEPAGSEAEAPAEPIESEAEAPAGPVASPPPPDGTPVTLGEMYAHNFLRHTPEHETWQWLKSLEANPEQCRYAFGASWNAPPVMIVREPERVPEHLWFIGDLHGDLLAMDAILCAIDRETPDATLVFLGDLFDRHPYGYETVMRLLGLIKERPGKILWIAGNHDIGLSADPSGFRSDCTPSDFTGYLNARPELREFGEALCRLMQRLPRALILPDGLLCAHGGVPHGDLLAAFDSEESLCGESMLSDFTWNRIHYTAPLKRVNRSTRGGELGYENVKAFCQKASEILKMPVNQIVCGHQHPERNGKGFLLVKNPAVPILILNSSFFAEDMFASSRNLIPYVARHRPGSQVRHWAVLLPQHEIERCYPKPGEEIAAEI